MKFRDNPLLQNGAVQSWPPMWVSTDDGAKRPPAGDAIGTLTQVKIPDLTTGRICLQMRDGEERNYRSYLLIDNYAFLQKTYRLLRSRIGQPIENIGNSDID